MAKYRPYDQRQNQFMIMQPGKIAGDNRLLSTVDAFFEKHTDIEAFGAKRNNDAGGRPAVDPRMLLKVLFYSYCVAVFSSREMEERTDWDANYVFLCAGQSVDHSTICQFILDYDIEIRDVFTRLFYIADQLNLIGKDCLAIDGTKIRANVDKEFTGTVTDFKRRKEALEKKIAERLQQTACEDPAYRKRSEEKIKQMNTNLEKIDAFLEEMNESSDKQIRNLTDQDARMVKDQDRKYPGYNCQAVADNKHHLIVSETVTNEENDAHMLPVMVNELRRQTNIDPKQADLLLDSGYRNTESLIWAEKERLTVYMPEGRGEDGEQKRRSDAIGSRECQEEIDGDLRILTCPGGQRMTARKAIKTSRSQSYHFTPDPAFCQNCSLKDRCYAGIEKSTKTFIVKKERFDSLPLRKKMKERLSSQHGKHRMADRSCLIEHIFGEIKELKHFRRFFHRRLVKVQTIWSIVCTAYNFRKLANLGATL